MIKYTAKVRKIGTSKFTLIPSYIVNFLNLKEGGFVHIIIEKIDGEEFVKKYQCKVCQLIFDTDDKSPYCPTCGEEHVKEVFEE